MSGPVIVLGWDALDIEVIEKYALSGQFGLHQKKIETYVNPVTGEPHTKELWPSLITGLHPDDHGLHAKTEDGGVEWGNPIINTASTVANGVVPQVVLSYIGRRLRERGAAMAMKQTDYYANNGISTVFDDRQSHAISIPNHQTEFDRKMGLDANRDDVWASLLVNRDGTEGYQPGKSTAGVYDILGRELGKRIGVTLNAINSGASLVWTWFGLLDTVGHMAPAMTAPIERDWYQIAAGVTETIKACAPNDATILSISDHGLQDGHHTHYATLCTDNPDASAAIDGIYDVVDWIDERDPQASAGRREIDTDAMDGVRSQLEDLGYV